MQNNMGEENKPYKIMKNDVVTVHRTDVGDYTFYEVQLQKKSPSGQVIYGAKQLRFKADVELLDNTKIRILDFFEDFYIKNRYLTIWTIFVTDFEIIDKHQAIEEYNEMTSNGELPF